MIARQDGGETVSETAWKWYGGPDEEVYIYGPCDTRDEVIEEAVSDGMGDFEAENGSWHVAVHVCEAQNEPLRVADWLPEVDWLLELADDKLFESDRTGAEGEEGPFFECSKEQQADLRDRIRRACDEWQAANDLTFKCQTFSRSRKHEHVVVPLPADEEINR